MTRKEEIDFMESEIRRLQREIKQLNSKTTKEVNAWYGEKMCRAVIELRRLYATPLVKKVLN